ncbi:hypothetical protein RND61_05930 [Streptomyces sp. TRM76323]|uniref:Uncharacterized protein n=1 Tax=Streptomyces tamarix TaxID=3078565 RepID=A0ABU3QFR5_9ACTN|nr:hypothetical protein [Streptomyces tamarix]MDT9681617.1 hypothetical protein [Streptomyces tamarix]
MTLTVYTIEMAYAHMRSMQEQAHRSRVRKAAATTRQEAAGEGRATTIRTKRR